MSGTTVRLLRPGTVDYHEAWSWQLRAAQSLRDGLSGEALMLLEHPPVYTLGRRTRAEHILQDAGEIAARGAALVDVDRGGDVTFHGPGQLVGYPILDLRRRRLLPGDYVRMLEEMLLRALGSFGISGERVPGRPGVWAAGGKVGAIGVRVRGGVTTHGFALNVTTDLSWFDAIVPCGLADARVTSLAEMLAEAPAMAAVEAAVAAAFETTFSSVLEEAAARLEDASASDRMVPLGR